MLFSEVRQENCQNNKRYVLPLLEEGRDADLRALDLVKLILNPPEGTEPSAGGAAERHSDAAQETEESKRKFADRSEVLQDPDRTGHEGRGAGVTVQKRDTPLLEGAVIDLLCGDDGKVAVGEDSTETCNNPGSNVSKDSVGLSGILEVHMFLGSPDPNTFESECGALYPYQRQLAGEHAENQQGNKQDKQACLEEP